MKDKIRKFIADIISSEIGENFYKLREVELKHTADLARLMIDCKNNNLSLRSRDFMMRMNIHPNEFTKKTPIN